MECAARLAAASIDVMDFLLPCWNRTQTQVLMELGYSLWVSPARLAAYRRPPPRFDDASVLSPAAPKPQPPRFPVEPADLNELYQHAAACRACALHHGGARSFPRVTAAPEVLWIVEEVEMWNTQQNEAVQRFFRDCQRFLQLPEAPLAWTSLTKCRPPQGRDPKPEEWQSCLPYLQREIRFYQPHYLLVCGQTSAQLLLNTRQALVHLKGKTYVYQCGKQEIPFWILPELSFILKNTQAKKMCYEDLTLIQALKEHL